MGFAETIRASYGEPERQAGWQHTAVRHVLTVLGLGAKAIPARGQKLTFADFRAAFPTFPVYLTADKLKHPDEVVRALLDMDVTAGRRVYRFLKSPFYQAYLDARGLADEVRVRAAGVVFFHPKFQSLVLHDGPQVMDVERGSISVSITSPGGRLVHLEPLRQFAAGLIACGSWRPDVPE